MDWELIPTRANLHGHFSRDLKPVIEVNSGDRIICSIPDAAWNLVPKTDDQTEPVKVCTRDEKLDAGHCLVGPIKVIGAKPGMTLEVRVEKLRVGANGWTSSAGWPHRVHQRLGIDQSPEAMLYWKLDADSLEATNQLGHRVKLRPFLGVMGMPVDVEGLQPTPPPRRTGGNLDCKELIEGTSLFLPIEVEGGLFSLGDGHAAQGDGEICVTAIECPMERVEISLILHPEMKIGTPRARIEGAWITLGVDEDLGEAGFKAIEEMVDMIGQKFGLDRPHALALASVVVDLRVTQIVNGVQGIHAVLRDDAVSSV